MTNSLHPSDPWYRHWSEAEKQYRHLQTSAQEDDSMLQEGAARFRQAAVDYERHTSSAQPLKHHRRTDPPVPVRTAHWRRWLLVIAICLALVVALMHRAHAQTPTLLVRACPATPATTGFSACTNSTWSTPAPGLILDVLRASVTADVWVAPNQLVAGDRVFACEDPSIAAGPFKNCPSTLPGQTNNYLAATGINFGSPPAPPVTPTPSPATITVTLNWPAITQDNQTPPNTLPAIPPIAYQVFMRSTACATSGPACQSDYYGRPPVADVTTAGTKITNLNAGPYCFVVGAYFQGDPTTLGAWSNESCITGIKVTPAQVGNLTLTWQ